MPIKLGAVKSISSRTAKPFRWVTRIHEHGISKTKLFWDEDTRKWKTVQHLQRIKACP